MILGWPWPLLEHCRIYSLRRMNGKSWKTALFCVLCDMQVQSISVPFKFNRSRIFSDCSQRSFGWNILNYFPLETTRPGCTVNHHFGTVTLCLQKISKFIVKTNLQKVHLTLKSQGVIRTEWSSCLNFRKKFCPKCWFFCMIYSVWLLPQLN